MKVTIPTSLLDITISQFVEFQKSEQTNNDLLQIFCDIENTSVLKLKDFEEIATICTEVLNQQPQFHRHFTYNGVKYGFIPKLDNLSTSEHIDLEMYMSKPDTFHKAMSILYRPIIKYKRNWFKKNTFLYDIAPYNGANDTFKDAPLEYYLGSCVFFYNLLKELSDYMVDYSMKIMKKYTP